MNDYQNIYIILCVVIIYSCIRINTIGFVSILAFTLAIMFVDDQTKQLSHLTPVQDDKKYAMLSSEDKSTRPERKVTVNPRKMNNTSEDSDEEEQESNKRLQEYKADTKRDKKPSPYQHSYEQRKRLLEGAFLDLESTNKWKSSNQNECNPIRGKTSSKL